MENLTQFSFRNIFHTYSIEIIGRFLISHVLFTGSVSLWEVRIKRERRPSSASQVKSHIQFVFKLDIKEDNEYEVPIRELKQHPWTCHISICAHTNPTRIWLPWEPGCVLFLSLWFMSGKGVLCQHKSITRDFTH